MAEPSQGLNSFRFDICGAFGTNNEPTRTTTVVVFLVLLYKLAYIEARNVWCHSCEPENSSRFGSGLYLRNVGQCSKTKSSHITAYE
jgi:hypothetical protein